MNEESKQGAPGGASSATACEDCWRPKDGPGGCSAHERNADHYGWTEDCQRATIARLRSSLSTAEKERQAARDAAYDLGVREAIQRSRADAPEKQLSGVEAVINAALVVARGDRHCTCMSPMAKGCITCEALDELEAAVKAYDAVADAAQAAPKASEIASDSSALEKALGALRERDAEWRSAINTPHVRFHREEPCDWCAPLCAILSGGEHVDALKAPKGEP